ncbi:MAG: hypothetical protein E3K36_07820 [Candidatus Brocadia sp.]|nr:hypothetical protein [Candidatus Brocadia sp.]
MIKQFFTILVISLLITKLGTDMAYADKVHTSIQKIQYPSDWAIDLDRRPDTEDILRSPFSKIEYLTSQATGIGYGRPGTEEYLNAEILVKLKEDNNIYGFSLIFSDGYGHGSSKAMFDTLLAALVNDLKVEILYYKKDGVKQGAKQIVRITIKK